MGLLDWAKEKGKHIYDSGASLVGAETFAESDRKETAQQAKQAHQKQMSQLDQRNASLKDGVSGYDQPGITQCVNWDGFSHDEIYQTNQDSIKGNRAGEIADAWKELGQKLRDRGPDFAQRLNDAISSGWEGEAADKAKTVSKPVADWMEGSGNAFEWTGNNLHTVGDSADKAKNMVGEPEGFNGFKTTLKVVASPGPGGLDELGSMEQRQEEEKAARQTMQRVYSPTMSQVDQQMPQFQKPDGTPASPPPPSDQAQTPWGGGGGSTDPAGTTPSGIGGGTPGGMSTANTPGGSADRFPGGNTPSPGAPGAPGQFGPSAPGNTTPNTATPAAAMPGGPGSGLGGGAGNPGGGAPGGAAPGGMVGGPGGGPGGGSAAGPGGRAGTGAPGGAPGGAGAGRGGAGRSGMGGMGGGRGGQGQGEDDEHERPSWLEENDDVWFNDMPKTAPPVLGE